MCIGAFSHFDKVVERLVEQLKAPLPGPAAHALLAPQPRRQWPDGFDPREHPRRGRPAAACFPIAERAHIVLTLRADTLGRHGGQVSLPGGVVDPGETVEQAACAKPTRKSGCRSRDARVIGRLTPLDIPISGFRLHPVVAVAARPSRLAAPPPARWPACSKSPLDDLCDRSCLVTRERQLERDGALVVPAFHVAGHEIWGATAMVLAEFLSLLGWPSVVLRHFCFYFELRRHLCSLAVATLPLHGPAPIGT